MLDSTLLLDYITGSLTVYEFRKRSNPDSLRLPPVISTEPSLLESVELVMPKGFDGLMA